MKTGQREVRQSIANFLRVPKDREFTIRQIALAIGVPNTQELLAVLASVVRCPFTSCQSIDTALSVQVDNEGYEAHHCYHCDRNFHAQRHANGYTILGWYGE